MSKKPTITLRAPLVTHMPIWEYLRYQPWNHAGSEYLPWRWEEEEYNRLCQQSTRAQELQALSELDNVYHDNEFLRGPEDFNWVLLEERFPPEIRTWKQELRRRFDGGQGLSDTKRALIQSIIEPIWEDAKFTFGRIQDLCQEIQQGTASGYVHTRYLLHKSFLLRITQSVNTGLANETDGIKYTKEAIRSILSQTMAREHQLWLELSTVIKNVPD